MANRKSRRYTLADTRGVAASRQGYLEGIREANSKYAIKEKKRNDDAKAYSEGFKQGKQERKAEYVRQDNARKKAQQEASAAYTEGYNQGRAEATTRYDEKEALRAKRPPHWTFSELFDLLYRKRR